MPDQQKQLMEYYQKNPSAASTLRGSIYEEKIINLIKKKSRKTTKTISTNEADQFIKKQHTKHDHPHEHNHPHEEESKKPKKVSKSSKKTKKIRKK